MKIKDEEMNIHPEIGALENNQYYSLAKLQLKIACLNKLSFLNNFKIKNIDLFKHINLVLPIQFLCSLIIT